MCLNQYIDPAVHFSDFKNKPNTVVWTNIDYSDEDKPGQVDSDHFLTTTSLIGPQVYQFAMKFKNCELKEEFLKSLEECRKAEVEQQLANPSKFLEEQKGFGCHDNQPTNQIVELFN